MSINTDRAPTPSRRRQWLWFVALWCAGLIGALLLAAPVKLLLIAMR